MSKETTNQSAEYNIIASGTKLTGDITSETNFRLDGQIKGSLNCKCKVIIGGNGSMEGDLICEDAEIVGSFKGKLEVRNMLSLKSTSRVEGEIHTKILSVEPNAKFTGTCDMADKGGVAAQPIKK